jgi:hypothetical protein
MSLLAPSFAWPGRTDAPVRIQSWRVIHWTNRWCSMQRRAEHVRTKCNRNRSSVQEAVPVPLSSTDVLLVCRSLALIVLSDGKGAILSVVHRGG